MTLAFISGGGSGLARYAPGVCLETAKPDSNPDRAANMLAEGAGFEPARLSSNGFQDRRHRPLGHPSIMMFVCFPRFLSRSNPFKASHIGTQDFRYDDAAVSLLIVFHYGHNRSADGQA